LGHKEYDEKANKKFNDPAINCVFKNIKSNVFWIKRNEKKYDIDIQIMKSLTLVGGIEVENHEKYWNDYFSFNSVHFLERKLKYAKPYSYYIQINKGGTNAVMIPLLKLLQYPISSMDNAQEHNEPFIDVKNEQCIWGWENIRNYIENEVKIITIKDLMKINKIPVFI
jgi:hypothetical protein